MVVGEGMSPGGPVPATAREGAAGIRRAIQGCAWPLKLHLLAPRPIPTVSSLRLRSLISGGRACPFASSGRQLPALLAPSASLD